MILLHTTWGVITFAALDKNKWFHLAFVWIAHITVSCMVIKLFYSFTDIEGATDKWLQKEFANLLQ